MKYVYAVRRPAPLPGVAGLDDAALEVVDAGGIEAVCSASARAPQADAADLWRHETVVEALMGIGGVLPARFGTRLRSDGAISALLEEHRARLQEGLDAVAGRVELGVRVLWEEQPPASPAPASTTGRDYLRARAAAGRAERAWQRRAEQRAERLHAPLSARAVAATLRVLPAAGTLMAGAYLVPADDVAAFGEVVTSLAGEHRDLALVPTGPWPPYSFAPDLDPVEPDRVP